MNIKKVTGEKKQYIDLLLLADEQEDMVDKYLERGEMFVWEDDGIKAECVITKETDTIYELKNIAVLPDYQRKGCGKRLIEFIFAQYPACNVLFVGTGDCPSSLSFYHNCGFAESHRVKNFFIDHYDHQIFEDGIQLIDMVYLKRERCALPSSTPCWGVKRGSMMRETTLKIEHIPAVVYGEKSDKLYLFVHGKQGKKEEAKKFAEIVHPKGWQVLAIDLPQHGERKDEAADLTPWHVVPELQAVMGYAKEHWAQIALRCTSIGAWFSMLALGEEPLSKALFVSPVLDMERLIGSMMLWAGVDEAQLQAAQEIVTDFGETLSWKYFQYAKEHPVTSWRVDTAILYPGKDHLTERTVVDAFAHRFGCGLTVLEEAEHWLHTPEQLAALGEWEAAWG